MRNIETIRNESENYDRYSSVYGVQFQLLPNEALDGLMLDVQRMSLARDSICESVGVWPEPKTTLLLPSKVLSMPLNDSQIKHINELETSAIAASSTEVQEQLMTVPIEESFESLSYLPDIFTENQIEATFSTAPFHEACGEWGGKQRQFWARDSFAKRLAIFGKLLNEVGVRLHIEDAFRPPGVQEGLFKRRVDWTARDHPQWSRNEIIQEARSKTAAIPRLASHKGAAAVDATLRYGTNKSLSFGHAYPDGGSLVHPKTPFVTAEQWRNRQLFQVAAGAAGLTLYVGEDWHVSYGDNLASLDARGIVDPNYVAIYGPIKAYHLEDNTCIIDEVYDEEEMNEVFKID